MEAKKIEQKWTAEAMNKIMANQISQELSCEVHVESDSKPEKGERVKSTLYYGDRKRPVGTDMVTSGGHAFFRGITVKQCGEFPEENKFRVKFETIAKPEEPKPEDKKKPHVDTVKDSATESEEVLKKEILARERREREERKRARREERDKEDKLQKKDTAAPAETAAISTPREKFLRLAGRSPNGMRGTQIAVLLYSKVEGVDVPEPGDGIIFNDPCDRMEGAVTNRFGVADATVPFAGPRMIYVKHASGPAALHVSVN